jgi:hypothetical protein
MTFQARSQQTALRTIHSIAAILGACFIVWATVSATILAMGAGQRMHLLDLDLYGRIETGSLICLLFFGLPVQFGLQRAGLNHWWIYSAAGAVFGGLIGLSIDYVIMNYDSEGFEDAPFVLDSFATTCIGGGALLGAAHAWVAWLIRRPDRDNVAVPKAIKTA